MDLWIKALHIVSVIAVMAGLLYLPRLFVYHADAPRGSPLSETFKVMERRLLRYIMTPALIVVWLSGFWLAYATGYLKAPWLHAKLLLVLLLSALHGFFAKCVKDFARDANVRTARFYRLVNEVPTVAMILIVILVVVKPF
jgi:protoporphyrinogen IX oxidase